MANRTLDVSRQQPFAERETAATVDRMVDIIGLTVVVVGLVQPVAAPFFSGDLLPSLLLLLAFGLACLTILKIDRTLGHDLTVGRSVAGCCFLGGFAAILFFLSNAGLSHSQPIGIAALGAAFVGCLAILFLVWQLYGSVLAITTAATLIFGMIWQQGSDLWASGAIERVQSLLQAIHIRFEDGEPGALFALLLSTALPLFLLGAVLERRAFRASAVTSVDMRSLPPRHIFSASQDIGLLSVSCAIIAAVIMTERPGIAFSTTLTASLLPIAALVAIRHICSRARSRTGDTVIDGWRGALSIGSAFAALLLSYTSGLSLAGSALLALAAVSALCFIDKREKSEPRLWFDDFIQGSSRFASFLIMAAAAGLTVAVLDYSALPIDIAQFLAAASGESRFVVAILTIMIAFTCGAVMPAIAAYLIISSLLATSLRTVGVTDLAIHLSVLFACLGGAVLGRIVRSKDRTSSIGADSAFGIALVGLGLALASEPALLSSLDFIPDIRGE